MGKKALYDWEGWFGVRRFRVTYGTHYFIGNAAMAQQIRNAAKKLNLSIKITEGMNGEGKPYITVHSKPKEAATSGRAATAAPPRPVQSPPSPPTPTPMPNHPDGRPASPSIPSRKKGGRRATSKAEA